MQVTSSEESERIFAILNDVRILVLHLCGSINNDRNNLALRAVNPTFNLSDDSADYTMDPSKFQETLAHNTNIQKTLKEAAARRSKQVFPRDSTQGSGGSPHSTSDISAPNQARRLPNINASHSRPFNSHRPHRNNISSTNTNANNAPNNRQ